MDVKRHARIASFTAARLRRVPPAPPGDETLLDRPTTEPERELSGCARCYTECRDLDPE